MALAHLVRPHVGKPCGTAFFSKAHLRSPSSGEKSQNPCREKEKNRDRGCGRPVEAAISSAVCDGVCLVADSGKVVTQSGPVHRAECCIFAEDTKDRPLHRRRK